MPGRDPVAQRQIGENACGLAVMHAHGLGHPHERAQRICDAEALQDAHAVGPELDPRAHRRKGLALLEHNRRAADACQCQGHGQAADAAARNQDRGGVGGHDRVPRGA